MILLGKQVLTGATWADELFQGGCVHNDKRIKPQDILPVWAKFLSEKSETEYPEIREELKKKKKSKLQMTF